MKYFSPAWHCGEVDDETSDAVVENYRRYLASLLSRLPPDVRTLATSVSLHDGFIRQIISDPEQSTLFLGLCCGDNQVGYCNLDLYYSQVFFLPSERENLAALEVDRKSTVMYDEVDIESGRFVHRILFLAPSKPPSRLNRYHEVSMHFEQLRLVRTPCDSPYIASRTGAV